MDRNTEEENLDIKRKLLMSHSKIIEKKQILYCIKKNRKQMYKGFLIREIKDEVKRII